MFNIAHSQCGLSDADVRRDKKKRGVDALPFAERRGTVRTKVLVPPTHKAIPAFAPVDHRLADLEPQRGKTIRAGINAPSLPLFGRTSLGLFN